jgi:HEPN domain-containing protein
MDEKSKFQKILDMWEKNAFNDLKASKILVKNNQLLLSMFHLQQAVEKYIKMYFIIVKNEQPPFVHHLMRLAELSGLTSKMGEAHKDLMNELNGFYIHSRYPNVLVDLESKLDIKSVSDFIVNVEVFLEWLKQEMKH